MSQLQAVWRMATEYPRSNISGIGLETFAREVRQRTGGSLQIEPVFESAVGSGDLIDAVGREPDCGGDAFMGPLEAIDPLFGLSSLPFVVRSAEEAQDLARRARAYYEACFARLGMTVLYVTVWPPTGLWSHQPLQGPDDIRSLAIRVYDYKSAGVMQTAGARALYLPFREAIERVSGGELNGILTSGDGGAGLRLWESLKHFTAINYAVPLSIAFVRTDAFTALAPDVRDQVLVSAKKTERQQFELLKTRTAENYRRMIQNGVTISDPPSRAVISLLKESAAATIATWKASVPCDVAKLVEP